MPSRIADVRTTLDDALGEVDELDALVGLHEQRSRHGRRGGPVAEVACSRGLHGRSTVELLLISSRSRSRVRARILRVHAAADCELYSVTGAILPAQLTLELLHTRLEPTLPGGHAKWVQIPRGAATVSGECHPRLPASAGCHCAPTAHSARRWEGWDGATIRKPGYLDAGPSFSHRRETRREGAPMRRRPLRLCSSPPSLLLLILAAAAALTPRPVTGRVVDPDGRPCPARGCSLAGDGASLARAVTDGARRVHARRAATAARSRSASRSTASAPKPVTVTRRATTARPRHDRRSASARSPNRSSCRRRRSRFRSRRSRRASR